MRTLEDVTQELMKDPEFAREYEAIQPEMDIIRAMIDARHAKNLTQKELAERTGINQADISKLENGTRNPSLKMLKRLAEGMDMTLRLEFVPKKICMSAGLGSDLKPRFLRRFFAGRCLIQPLESSSFIRYTNERTGRGPAFFK